MEERVRLTLRICPECHEPMQFVNGESINTLTFWGDVENPFVTPHDTWCPYRGCALP